MGIFSHEFFLNHVKTILPVFRLRLFHPITHRSILFYVA